MSLIVSLSGRDTSPLCRGSALGLLDVQWPSTTKASSPSLEASSTTFRSAAWAFQLFRAFRLTRFANLTSAGARATLPGASRSRQPV